MSTAWTYSKLILSNLAFLQPFWRRFFFSQAESWFSRLISSRAQSSASNKVQVQQFCPCNVFKKYPERFRSSVRNASDEPLSIEFIHLNLFQLNIHDYRPIFQVKVDILSEERSCRICVKAFQVFTTPYLYPLMCSNIACISAASPL